MSGSATVGRSQIVLVGFEALILTAPLSGLALFVTDRRCDSDAEGNTTSSDWEFSSYCKALQLHPYTYPDGTAPGSLANGAFALPTLALLCGSLVALRARRLGPLWWALGICVALVVVLFVLALAFATRTFHPCC